MSRERHHIHVRVEHEGGTHHVCMTGDSSMTAEEVHDKIVRNLERDTGIKPLEVHVEEVPDAD